MIGISFFDEPTDVIEHIKKKKNEIHFDYDEISHEAHLRTFTVAKITNLDLLNDIHESLIKAAKNGENFETWKANITPVLQKYGWIGKEVEVKNPKTGEVKKINVGARRLKTIFETNIRTAYAKAKFDSQMASSKKYFRYTAVLDGRTRAEHRAMHGIILPKEDKFWKTNYPPNGWGCRCKVVALDDEDLKRFSAKPLKSSKGLENIASKDFAYSFGDEIKQILTQKAKSKKSLSYYKQELKKIDRSVNERKELYLKVKNLYKNGGEDVALGRASEFVKSFLDPSGEKIKNDEILLSEYTINKNKKHSELLLSDYIFVDELTKKERITGIYEDEAGNKKIFASAFGKFYRFVLKVTSRGEIFLDSLVTSDEKKIFKKLDRVKKKIYAKE